MEMGSRVVDSSLPPPVVPAASPLAAHLQPAVSNGSWEFNSTGGRRVLIVENDLDLANFLAEELRESRFLAEVVPGCEQMLELLQGNTWYDLLMLDLGSPPSRGIALLHRLRPMFPRLPILALTTRNSVEDKVLAFEAGADDCVAKPLSLTELFARVRALMRRHGATAPNCSRVGDLVMNREERRVERNGRRIDLTPRELAILDLMMRNAGRPVSRATLVNEVWKMPDQPSTNIVDVYIKYVRDKVDFPGEPRLIRTIRGFGYELRET
ncbi:response regulator transcription factor [Edaphobacter sp.]|uniref:response regulator transcription factor n=1 Tax=Edaphobacter sp. TaxID=1934404 RepID=UPI002D8045F5|nr:response regulator transcription factor [Edaphobacter sp.]